MYRNYLSFVHKCFMYLKARRVSLLDFRLCSYGLNVSGFTACCLRGSRLTLNNIARILAVCAQLSLPRDSDIISSSRKVNGSGLIPIIPEIS